ncbi:hypothetical protein MPSI1_001982 [Malassezia psittaci]|uniref:Protein arginine methyltransferase NDUFAF7 n=1 Tax=Malassezia psittaci TaxID=1821823 RepID=A0AAF0JKE4_9BASI|nr:hypothetical protein MPSI1_001982 [Malassezia psittaci]
MLSTEKIARDEGKGALLRVLSDSIRANGPMTVPTYMQACLTNPDHGYYAGKLQEESHGILGAKGDFITSPEISQVFGELLAVFFVSRWQAAGSPNRIRIIELGPGRGTLLSDMLRTFSAFPPMFDAIRSLELVEASPALLTQQEQSITTTLKQAGKKIVSPAIPVEELESDSIRAEWFPSYHGVNVDPDSWTIVMAHEFFDALPIHIFEKKLEGWREVLVDVNHGEDKGVKVLKASDIINNANTKEKDPELRFVVSPGATAWSQLLAARNERFKHFQPGQRVEVSPVSWAVARRMGEWISGYDSLKVDNEGRALSPEESLKIARERSSLGGCGLVVDYGADRFFGDSFRAFRNHKIVSPLELPGQSDLTANVDFTFLSHAITTTDAQSYGPMTQRDFLASLGLNMRLKKLLEDNPPSRSKDIQQAAARLVDPTGMGEQYKVLCVSAERAEKAGERSPEEIYPFL